MKRLFLFAAKVAISALLFYLSLRLVNLNALQERLNRIEPPWIVAMLLGLGVQIGLASLRWQRIAGACGVAIKFKKALHYTLIGAFFNQALPSTVGGDAARIWLVARDADGWKGAVSSVLIDRASGLIWLALLVLLCLPWSLALIQNPIGRTALILIGIGSVAGPLALFAITRVGRIWLDRWRPTRQLAELAETAWKVLASASIGIAVAALSISVQLLTVLVAWFAAKAIGSSVSLLHSLLLIPPVILIAAIPVSIAGWGVREGAMVAAFTFAGLSDTDALAISVLFGAGLFAIGAIGAIGGLVWIFGGERVRIAAPANGAPPGAP